MEDVSITGERREPKTGILEDREKVQTFFGNSLGMKRSFTKTTTILLGIFLFVAALLVLHRELKEYRLHDIILQFHNLPAVKIIIAAALTILSYLLMTGYDYLAFRYIHHTIEYRKTAFVSFISYAFSNNMGAFMFSGMPVRFRLYSAWGLSTVEITNVIAFCTLSLWLGFMALGGTVFLIGSFVIPPGLPLYVPSLHIVGIIFFIPVTGYLLTGAFRKKPLTFHGWTFSPVPLSMSLSQLLISSLDWTISAGVLYTLLSPHGQLSFIFFLSIFIFAQFAGLISTIPGGLGVFETVIVLSLSSLFPTSSILGSLLAYRAIYYLMPLIVSLVLLGTYESFQAKKLLQRTARIFGKGIIIFAPHILSITTFLSGTVLLVSGSTPAVKSRMLLLKELIPLPVVELSHFLGSLAGAGLIILARALQRRIDAAYILTLILLGGGVGFSILKGADYEEAVILAVMFFALLPCRRYFYRRASLFDIHFTPGWIMAITLVITGSLWLGLFSHKHVEYSHELWWQFEFAGDAPRFFRAAVGVIVIFLLYSAVKLLSPVKTGPAVPTPSELEKALTIAAASRSTTANLALLGDKALLFSSDEKAFLMYAIEGRSWVSMGDPIGSFEAKKGLIWQFREMCDQHDGWPVFYEAGGENLNLYIDLGLTFVKLGEEGRVNLGVFSLEGGSRKEFRNTIHKLDKQGCSFEIVPREGIPSLLPEMKVVSDSWLQKKHTGEKGFSLGFFKQDYLRCFPAAVVRQDGKIQAFANIWSGAEKEELSIDLMRYRPEAPHDTMDYLFVKLMLWGKQEGYQWFSLGMAPFSGLDEHALAPLWNKLGAFLYRHGEHFYNFQGIRFYKEKFGPEWKSRYLVAPGGFVLPRILTNIASLVSRGLKGVVAK
jgi:phosphatidylglycerol lysyltransferase